MSELKASELLLDLDNRIKNIEKQLKLQEFQLRIIIDNFNRFFSKSDAAKAEPKVNQVKEIIPEVKFEAKPTEPKAVELKEDDKDYVFNSKVITDKPKEKKKVAVTQLIKLNNGEPLVGANVLIYTSTAANNKNLVKKVTTNTVGRWQAFLSCTKYIVDIVGTTSSSEDIEFSQTFQVPESDVPFTLPSPNINQKTL